MDEIEVLKETNVIPDSCNIVRGQGYTVSRDPDHGLDGVLTDGRYGVTGTGRDKNWLGFSKSKNADKNHVELVLSLIHISFQGAEPVVTGGRIHGFYTQPRFPASSFSKLGFCLDTDSL